MKRLFSLTVHLVLFCLLVAAQAGPSAAQGRADTQVKMGKKLFMTYCSSCHGADARGDGPVAEALKVRPADLTTIAARRDGEFPAAEIAMFIDGRTVIASHGSREMPVWGQRFREELGKDSVAEEITRGRIDVLIAYLRSIQAIAESAAPPPGKH
ncbi:MAG: c-type cytochrome [Deltaproteobacteria bacterium]|nr:c-type cytochrome [Deltaproteobacteria bacterium]